MRIFWSIIIGLILSISFASNAKASENLYKKNTGFNYLYTEAYDLKNTNGNERLYNKKLADIERASADTIHYDSQIRSHYMCDWQYNKVLGRWVCGKDYMKAYSYTHPQPIQACSFGYELNYGRTGCVRIRMPANAHYNSLGTGWECNPGFHTSHNGTTCLSDKYVYTQCPGGSGSCKSTTYQQPCTTGYRQLFVNTPVYEAQTIYVKPIVYVLPTTYVETEVVHEIQEVHLAQTGPKTFWFLVFGVLGLIIFRISRTFTK